VDLIVARDRTPWFLVEVKQGSGPRLSPSLAYFQRAVGAAHAFQVVMDAPYNSADSFKESRPVIVPAQTFLSQLV